MRRLPFLFTAASVAPFHADNGLGGYALTMFLPVRSDLYACFPSVGPSLAAAAVCGRLWDRAPPDRQRRALVAALIVVMIAGPVHYARAGAGGRVRRER
jgi:hypothetical protein